MKRKTILTTLLASAAALCITCTGAFASQAVVDNHTYAHQNRFDDAIIVDGVDISYWQGDAIDWNQVKRHGMDYVFIRLGSSDFDDPTATFQDRHFEANYANASAAGLMTGIYYRSDATTVDQAVQEAQFVLNTLAGRDLDLPVVFDYELGGRIVDTTQMTSCALAFLNHIQANSSYTPMFYSYRSMMDPNFGGIGDMHLIDSKYPVWVAQYDTDINSYNSSFIFWQYTDRGQVPGITGSVDCNFWYFDEADYPAAKGKKSISNATVKLATKTYIHDGQPKTPAVTVTQGGKTLIQGADYKVHYIKNTLAGDAYALIEGIGQYDGMKSVKFGVYKPLTTKNKPINVKANLRAAKTTGFDDIKVTWQPVPGATSYRVYYKKASASAYKYYKKVSSGDSTTLTLTDMAKGTKYNIKVIAYGVQSSKSSFSAIKSVTTLKKVTQNKVKKYNSSKVKLSWVNISGETGYQISKSTKKNGINVVKTVKSASAKSTTMKVKKGKTYYYKVRPYKLVNGVKVCGPWSVVRSYKL